MASPVVRRERRVAGYAHGEVSNGHIAHTPQTAGQGTRRPASGREVRGQGRAVYWGAPYTAGPIGIVLRGFFGLWWGLAQGVLMLSSDGGGVCRV